MLISYAYKDNVNPTSFSHTTDGWSACSVKDFTKHFNKYKTAFCLPQKNMGKECLAECNNESGLCEDFCGTKNYCCKRGMAENGCDGKVGGKDHHVCVQEPLGNTGECYPLNMDHLTCLFNSIF